MTYQRRFPGITRESATPLLHGACDNMRGGDAEENELLKVTGQDLLGSKTKLMGVPWGPNG